MGIFKKKEKKQIITIDDIMVGLESVDKFEAIRMAGEMLVKKGCAGEDYVESMIDREKLLTTYLDGGIAIPHGTRIFKREVKETGIVCLQFPNGIDFDGEKAHLIIGVAGVNNDHLEVLKGVATIITESAEAPELIHSQDKEFILKTLEEYIIVR